MILCDKPMYYVPASEMWICVHRFEGPDLTYYGLWNNDKTELLNSYKSFWDAAIDSLKIKEKQNG